MPVARVYDQTNSRWVDITGPRGPSGAPIGSVATTGDLPLTASVDDVYTVDADGHAYRWDGSAWVDIGAFRGPGGIDTDLRDRIDPGTAGSSGQYLTVGPSGVPDWLDEPVFNVKHPRFGATGNGTTDDTDAIWAALTAGAGGSVTIPRGTYSISAPLTVAANTEVVIQPGTIIDQTTKYTPVFDILDADDVVIRGNGALLRWSGSRAYTFAGGSVRGDDPYAYGAGVWSNGNRTRIHDLRASGFTAGVYLSAWNGTTLANEVHSDNEVHNLHVTDVDFGVLFGGQVNPKLRNITGSTTLQIGSGNPDHLIYVTDTGLNRGVDIDGGNCTGSEDAPYQFKGIAGGRAVNLYARDAPGLVNLQGCTDFHVQGANSNDTASGENNPAVQFLDSSCARCVVDAVTRADDTVTGSRVAYIHGTDNVVRLKARARQTTDADLYHVRLAGTRNALDLDLVNIANDGTDLTTGRRVLDLWNGTGHAVRIRRARNIRGMVDVTAGVTNCTIEQESRQVVPVAAALVPLSNNNEPTTLLVRNGRADYTASSGLAIAPDISRYALIVVAVNSNVNFSMDGYYGALNRGDRVTVQISRNTATMGTVTWYTGTVAGSWNLRSAWSNPANGFTAILEFQWNGTQMVELYRVVV
jgi:hypothetical protein